MASSFACAIFVWVFFCVSNPAVNANEDYEKASDALQLILMKYDRRLRPGFGSEPVEISVNVNVDFIEMLPDHEMGYKVQMTLQRMWKDSRLAHNYSSDLVLGDFEDDFWVPDLYFPEAESVRQDKKAVLVRLSPDGNVFYSSQFDVVRRCAMDLRGFPFDVQTCHLILESFTYTTSDLRLKWNEDEERNVHPVYFGNLVLPRSRITDVSWIKYSLIFAVGEYDNLEVTFVIARDPLSYTWAYFVPAVLVVFLSWTNFWIKPECIGTRVGIALSSCLSLLALYCFVVFQCPKTSYLKLIDVFYVICLLFVFLALAEFILVILIRRNKNKCSSLSNPPAEEEKLDEDLQVETSVPEPSSRASKWAQILDLMSRALFPLGFFFILLFFILAI